MIVTPRTRQIYLDIAKGIGIILVVWAHAEGPFSHYINGFHMPFFFFISGILYKSGDRSIKSYAIHKCKTLLVPFWWWNLIFYPMFFVLFYWKNWDPLIAVIDVGEIVLTLNKVPFLGATWFLPALFWVSVVVHIILTLSGKKKTSDIILLIIGIAVSILGFQITFPYKISRVLICALFYVAGYLYQKYVRGHIAYAVSTVIAAVSIVAYIFCAKNNNFSMGDNTYEHKVLFVLGAFLAIYFTLWLSESLDKIGENHIIIEHIIYLGENSIDIVIWQFLAFRLTILIQIVCLGADIGSLTAFPVYDASGIWWSIYFLSGIYGSLLWKYILEHNPLLKYLKKKQ